MNNRQDCDIIENEFELQSRYYVHFRTNILGKSMDTFISSSYGLNCTNVILK